MTKTTKDYSGRTVDVEFLQHVSTPATLIGLTKTLRHDNMTRRVTGLQKLAQRYALILLTPRSTLPMYPEYGTDLVTYIQNGAVNTRAQLASLFSFANSLAMQQLAVEVQDSDPDDEVLDTAELEDYDIDYPTSTVLLKVRLTSLAGESYTYVIPA
jgi:phage baseplate assembly protein W